MTVVVVGAGQAGLAMSRQLSACRARPRRARTGRGRIVVAHRALGLAQAAHAELDVPPSGVRVRGARPRRLPDGGGDGCLARGLRLPHRRPGPAPGSRCCRCGARRVVSRSRPTTAVTSRRPLSSRRGRRATRGVPDVAAELPRRISQVTAVGYRSPAQLDATGDVLVVGASASGIQIRGRAAAFRALRNSCRRGACTAPATYRGRDIYWWLTAIGQLDERYDAVEDIERAVRHASVQLVGHPTRTPLDLNTVSAAGVDLVGRLMAVSGAVAQCSGGLASLDGERGPEAGAAPPTHRRLRHRAGTLRATSPGPTGRRRPASARYGRRSTFCGSRP